MVTITNEGKEELLNDFKRVAEAHKLLQDELDRLYQDIQKLFKRRRKSK